MAPHDRSDLGVGSLKPATGIAGGRREYRLARKEKPTMGARHTIDGGEASIVTPEAS